MRTLRIWLALSCSLALVVALAIRVVVAQNDPGDPLATEVFADASGGHGGSARGGDGGRGGSGFGPVCNQNTNDLFALDDEPKLSCGAGGAGGDGGDAGESVGGFGGIAFVIGGRPPLTTTTTIRNPLADVLISAIRTRSFDIDITNNGPDAANGVTFVVTIQGTSNSVKLELFNPPEGHQCTGQPVVDDQGLGSPVTITCQLGTLAVGELVTVVLNWHNDNECQETATVNATVSSTGPPDPNLTNNARSASQTKPEEDFC